MRLRPEPYEKNIDASAVGDRGLRGVFRDRKSGGRSRRERLAIGQGYSQRALKVSPAAVTSTTFILKSFGRVPLFARHLLVPSQHLLRIRLSGYVFYERSQGVIAQGPSNRQTSERARRALVP